MRGSHAESFVKRYTRSPAETKQLLTNSFSEMFSQFALSDHATHNMAQSTIGSSDVRCLTMPVVHLMKFGFNYSAGSMFPAGPLYPVWADTPVSVKTYVTISDSLAACI